MLKQWAKIGCENARVGKNGLMRTEDLAHESNIINVHGLKCDTSNDVLSFNACNIAAEPTDTKRNVSSKISEMYYLLDLLLHITIRSRFLMHFIWNAKT